MFSGIIKELAEVVCLEPNRQPKARLGVRAQTFLEEPPEIGESISICGACLTVVELDNDVAYFELAEETLRRTKLGSLSEGKAVNIERSLRLGGRLDGHIVLGHVDTCASLKTIESQGEGERYQFVIEKQFMRYIPEKGSITIDGVSLTVGETSEDSFSVYIIPHTKKITLFSTYAEGDVVNIEIDCLARYLEKLVAK
jgi:riboflavin synthase